MPLTRPTLWLRASPGRATVAAHLRALAGRFRSAGWAIVAGPALETIPDGAVAVVDDPWVELLPAQASALAAAAAPGPPCWRVPRLAGLPGPQGWTPRYAPETLLDYERESLRRRSAVVRPLGVDPWLGVAVAAPGEAAALLTTGWPPAAVAVGLVTGVCLYRYGDPAAHPREELARFVPPEARLVVDVGCGAGLFGARLRTAERRVIGIEPAWDLAVAASRRLDLVLPLTAEQGLPLLRRGADVIVFADVLEHTLDPAAVLEVARAALAPGGRIIASVPNASFAPALRALAAGRWDATLAGVQARDHYVPFTPASFAELASGCGLRLLAAEPLRVALPWGLRWWARLAAWTAGGSAQALDAPQWVAVLAAS